MSGLLPWLLSGTLRTLAATWRVEVSGADHLRAVAGRPFVFGLWHRTLLPLLWWHRGMPIALVVSRHRDGELVARAAEHLGYTILRGSSTRGGATALRGVLRALRAGTPVAITPDGPTGPAGSIKPGIVRAAGRAGVPILALSAWADRAWQARSWDQMLVPQPGAHVIIRYAAPIDVCAVTEPRAREALAGALRGLTVPEQEQAA